MGTNSKTHLILPDNSLVCKNYGSNITRDFKEVTCKSCLKAIANPKNKTWYKAVWEKFEREQKIVDFFLPATLVVYDKKPVPLNTGCENCGNEIKTMCFLGTDHCSEACRQDLAAISGGRV